MGGGRGRETHGDADVTGHIAKELVENPRYEVSEKHFDTNRHITSAVVSVSTTVMTPPHFGQTQDDMAEEVSVDGMMGAIPKRWRQRSRDEDRW